MQNIEEKKKKSQQILATVVMGINLVNSMAPMAMAAQKLPAEGELQVQPQSEAKPLEYTVLPQTLNFVENLVFGKAEAGESYYVGAKYSETTSSLGPNGRMDVDGGTGTVESMNGGYQSVRGGGTGYIMVQNDGRQDIYKGATGIIGVMHAGTNVVSGGTGMVETMNGGTQFISAGAIGEVGTMNGGSQYIFEDSKAVVRIMSGGMQAITAGGTGKVESLQGGTQRIVNGGLAVNTTINGGTQLIGGSAVNTTISGGAAVMQDSNAFVSGLTMAGGEYLLGADGGSGYKIQGKFSFTGGNFDMTKNTSGGKKGTHEKLTIDKLTQAGGTFIMDTDLKNGKGDKITITSANGGTSYIQVNDASLQGNNTVTVNKNLLLITDNSGKLTFEGKEINNGGLWEGTAEIENGANITGNSKEWYLTHIVKNINNDTEVLLEGSDNSYALWRNTNDTLRKHMGDLHYRSNKAESEGIWVHYIGRKFSSSDFDTNYNMYQFGYDKADNAKSIYGMAVEKGNGNASYGLGSEKSKLLSGSIYGTWTGDDGSYTDVVAKIGQFDTDIKSYGDYPDKASYKNKAYSLSVEYGKTIELNGKSGIFIEPQLQFTAGRLSSSEYTTDRGNDVYMSGVNSYVGRIGFTLGQELPEGNNIYLKASALHEFGGSRDIYMAAANGETMSTSKDYSDTWFEVGIGANIKLSKASYFYGDIERSFGGEIEKKWQVNAGIRFEF